VRGTLSEAEFWSAHKAQLDNEALKAAHQQKGQLSTACLL
jgi:hypothetical protein